MQPEIGILSLEIYQPGLPTTEKEIVKSIKIKICPNSTPRLKPIRLKIKDASDKPTLSKTDAKPRPCKSPKKNIVVMRLIAILGLKIFSNPIHAIESAISGSTIELDTLIKAKLLKIKVIE